MPSRSPSREVLKRHLAALADEAELAITDPAGRAKKLAVLSDELKRHRVYGEDWRAEIAGWLAIRNEIAHGRGKAISRSWLDRLVEGVEEFTA